VVSGIPLTQDDEPCDDGGAADELQEGGPLGEQDDGGKRAESGDEVEDDRGARGGNLSDREVEEQERDHAPE